MGLAILGVVTGVTGVTGVLAACPGLLRGRCGSASSGIDELTAFGWKGIAIDESGLWILSCLRSLNTMGRC